MCPIAQPERKSQLTGPKSRLRDYTIEVRVGGGQVSDGGGLVGVPIDSSGEQTVRRNTRPGPPTDPESAAHTSFILLADRDDGRRERKGPAQALRILS